MSRAVLWRGQSPCLYVLQIYIIKHNTPYSAIIEFSRYTSFSLVTCISELERPYSGRVHQPVSNNPFGYGLTRLRGCGSWPGFVGVVVLLSPGFLFKMNWPRQAVTSLNRSEHIAMKVFSPGSQKKEFNGQVLTPPVLIVSQLLITGKEYSQGVLLTGTKKSRRNGRPLIIQSLRSVCQQHQQPAINYHG